MTKIIQFPQIKKFQAEDLYCTKLADDIDLILLGALERLNISMVGIVLADRLGELLSLAAKNGHDSIELKEIYFKIITKRSEGVV